MTNIVQHANQLTPEAYNKLLTGICKISGHNKWERAIVPTVGAKVYSLDPQDALQEILTILQRPGEPRRDAALLYGDTTEEVAFKFIIRNALWLLMHARDAWGNQIQRFDFLDGAHENQDVPATVGELCSYEPGPEREIESEQIHKQIIMALSKHRNQRLKIIYEMVGAGEAKGDVADVLKVSQSLVSQDLAQIKKIILSLEGLE